MPDKSLSLQDQFLNSIRRSKNPVTVFLVKGVKLQGIVTWFDAFSLLLRREGTSQLVYKHAISTIMPAQTPTDVAAAGGAEAGGRRPALQHIFLQAAAREQQAMTIFLVNGVKLQGVVSWFDNFCVLLRRDGQSQLVYKHAISTIMPAQPVQLYEPGPEQDD